jgi:hypothetical protein
MIPRLYELLTGRPWTSVRSMTAEFGPPPGAVYATELAAYTDTELIANGGHILAHLRHQDHIAETDPMWWPDDCEACPPDCRECSRDESTCECYTHPHPDDLDEPQAAPDTGTSRRLTAASMP